MFALCAALLAVSPEAFQEPLEAAGRYAQPVGGAVSEWRLNPRNEEQLAALGPGGVFIRSGPATWAPVSADTVAGWPSAELRRERLATGRVIGVAVLPGVVVGAVPEGLVEGPSLSGRLSPVPLAIGVRAGALLSDGSALLAGDPEGLFRCPADGSPCRRLASESFTTVRDFDDGTWILGGVEGDLWRFAPDHAPHRVCAARDAIVSLDGVVDGGPRFALSRGGQSFRSEDHGLSWVEAPPAEGRLGPGGLLVALSPQGGLLRGSLTSPLELDAEAGTFEPTSRLYWAGRSAVMLVAGQTLWVYEPSRVALRQATFDGEVLDVQARDERIEVLLRGPQGVRRETLLARAAGLTRSTAALVRGALLWVGPLVVLLGVFGWTWHRRMRRLARPLGAG